MQPIELSVPNVFERLQLLFEQADVIHNSITEITILAEYNLKFQCALPPEFHLEVNIIVGQVRAIKEQLEEIKKEIKKGASSAPSKVMNEAQTKALANGKRI